MIALVNVNKSVEMGTFSQLLKEYKKDNFISAQST